MIWVLLAFPVLVVALAFRRAPLLVWCATGVLWLVLLGGALLSYPYTQTSVTRPALMAGDLDDQQAQQLLQALLKNIYRAFDFRDENDVYDKLALSVEGDLLTDIYLQNRKSFAVEKAGGSLNVTTASAAE